MMLIGAVLIYLESKKSMNLHGYHLGQLPWDRCSGPKLVNGSESEGVLDVLFKAGISTELFPLLIFIGIGAMIDFGPLLQNPFMSLFGAARQFGIFFTIVVAISSDSISEKSPNRYHRCR